MSLPGNDELNLQMLNLQESKNEIGDRIDSFKNSIPPSDCWIN